MKFLTRREQMVLALVLLAVVTGAGVQHCRARQGMPPADTAGEEGRP